MTTKKHVHLDDAGFSLVELFATVLIIAVLAAIILGVAGAANQKAATAKAQSEIHLLAKHFEEWKAIYGVYPYATQEDLSGLDLKDVTSNLPVTDILRFFDSDINIPVKGFLMDPWGGGYLYTGTNRTFEIWSLGADGREGSSNGDNFDLDNIHL